MTKLSHPAPGDTNDPDPDETNEWRAALDSVLHCQGPARAQQLLEALAKTLVG